MNSDEYRAFKARSERRWLGGLIAVLVCCNVLVLGPCDPVGRLHDKWVAHLRPELKYGDSLDWDGRMPFPRESLPCSFGHCFY